MVRARRRSPVPLAGLVAVLAVLAAAGGSAAPTAVSAAPVADRPAEKAPQPCCVQVVPAQGAGFAARPVSALFASAVPAQLAGASSSAASRWRVIDRALPPGVAPERGLQIDTIFLARSVSARFPQIHEIGGMRPDALRWHPDGLALDVMIPDPSSAAGIALGNQIVSYALENAARFHLQDAIWRGEYYTPSGPQYSGMAHFDHVHLTTYGGGYPAGGEIYYR